MAGMMIFDHVTLRAHQTPPRPLQQQLPLPAYEAVECRPRTVACPSDTLIRSYPAGTVNATSAHVAIFKTFCWY